MSERDLSLYIVDIFIAIGKIKRYTAEFENGEALLSSELHWDATIRELEIIGEATKYLLNSGLIDSQYRRIVDFRNQIAHGYFGIDEQIVWNIATEKIELFHDDLLQTIQRNNIDLTLAITMAKEEFSLQKDVVSTLVLLNSRI